MADLKPCPFCGGKASIHSAMKGYWPYCTNEECGAETLGCPTEEDAATRWNRRADDAEIASLRQQLADALKVANRQPPADTTDKSQIEFLVSILRRGRHGADISNQAASLIEALAEANFEMRFGVIRALSHPDREGERG